MDCLRTNGLYILVIMKWLRTNGLYILVGSSPMVGITVSVSSDKTKLWHMRLAHISERGLKELNNQGLFCNDKISSLKLCEKCVFRKAIRQNSTRKQETKQTLDYVHSNL